MKKPMRGAITAARQLATAASRSGALTDADLDVYLESAGEFEERIDALIAAAGDLPLLVGPLSPPDGSTIAPRPRVPAVADDDNLRAYLREVHARPRLEKPEEIALAKRLEFARRRFIAALTSARVGQDGLRQLLGDEFSHNCTRDLHLPRAAAAEPTETHRRRIRSRAGEMNRLRAQFVERGLAVVADLALCYRTYGVPLMDLIQEGNGALIRAVEKFDWRKDVRFNTYATFWIRQAIERSIAFNKGIVRVPNYLQQKLRRLRREGVLPKREASLGEMSAAFEVKREVAGHLIQTQKAFFSLDVAVDEDGETFASLLEGSPAVEQQPPEFPLLKSRLEEVLADLPSLERQILEQRFGLLGEPLTLEELGKRMNVSRERVRQLQVRALRKLQEPTARRRLSGFV
jgi:RNA polymerase primary sigma factor